MHHKAVSYLIYGELSFFLMMAVCFLLRPDLFLSGTGLSYYGNLKQTIVPYSLSFLVSSYFIWRSSLVLPATTLKFRAMRKAMEVYITLSFGILVTPFTLNAYVNVAHVAFTSILFLGQLGLGIWFVFYEMPDWLNKFLFAALIVATVLGTLSLRQFNVVGVLGYSQLAALSCFGLISVRTLVRLFDTSANA